MKKSFEIPFILRTNNDENGSVIGGASLGHGDPTNGPMTYTAWSASPIAAEYDEHVPPVGPDMYDYGLWWAESGFTEQQWEEYDNNPADWVTYVEPYL